MPLESPLTAPTQLAAHGRSRAAGLVALALTTVAFLAALVALYAGLGRDDVRADERTNSVAEERVEPLTALE